MATATVTALPTAEATTVTQPKAAMPAKTKRRVDPTNAARQRKHKAKVAALGNVTETAPAATAAAPSRRPSVAALGVAVTTGALLLVSLTHVADGVTALTGCTVAEAWAMAIGIDAMLISVLYAMLSAADDVRHAIHRPALALEGLTLVASAYLNALADSHGHFDVEHLPAILFGLFVPAAVALGSAILARLK
jgi:hypothetical protein